MHINEFSVSVYGNLEKYSDVASKARVRIFYKYGNRNGTYITDDFAESLIKTLPYTVISGIYSEEDHDFTDHGNSRAQSKIYGIVPETPNVLWEKHIDEDGVEREYACADVLLFTARYPESMEIVGKSQSMELYTNTLKYHREVINGQLYCVFDSGCFLGLQALGDNHEPCFEGAAFYELSNNIESVIAQIKSYMGGQKMPKLNFQLSDSDKFEAIWALLNPNYSEEEGWTIDYTICNVYDEYALVFACKKNSYERVYYTKDNETNSVAIGDIVEVYVMDITENEKNTIETLRTLNGGTYEVVSETLEKAQEVSDSLSEMSENFTNLSEEKSAADSKIVELNEEIATLNTKIENSDSEYETKCSELEAKTAECEELKTFKLNVESAQKEAVIAEYEDQLSEEILNNYREKISDYTALDLDKELAYELKKSNPVVFTKNQQNNGILPKDIPLQGIEAILSRYK